MKKRRVNKTPLFIIIVLICLIFGALYFFRGHFTKKEEEETKPEVLEKKEVEKTYNLSFTLAGRCLGGWVSILHHILPIFFLNLKKEYPTTFPEACSTLKNI